MKQLAVQGGIMLLAVPTGYDQLHWNIHRVYGRARLPLLLSSWKVEGIFGSLRQSCNFDQHPQLALLQVLTKVSWTRIAATEFSPFMFSEMWRIQSRFDFSGNLRMRKSMLLQHVSGRACTALKCMGQRWNLICVGARALSRQLNAD
jgi:hypothetical protein